MLSAATPLVGLLALGAPRAPKKRYPPPPPPTSPGHRVEITGGAFHRLRQITAEAAKEAIALRGHFAMAIGGDDLIPMLEKMGEYWGGEGEERKGGASGRENKRPSHSLSHGSHAPCFDHIAQPHRLYLPIRHTVETHLSLQSSIFTPFFPPIELSTWLDFF